MKSALTFFFDSQQGEHILAPRLPSGLFEEVDEGFKIDEGWLIRSDLTRFKGIPCSRDTRWHSGECKIHQWDPDYQEMSHQIVYRAYRWGYQFYEGVFDAAP